MLSILLFIFRRNSNSAVIDCRYYSDVGLKIMRWVNVRSDDVASIPVNVQVVWTSPANVLFDNQWIKGVVDISDIADGNPNVAISFGLTTNDYDWAGGWNIDDFMIKNQLMTDEVSNKNKGTIYHQIGKMILVQ